MSCQKDNTPPPQDEDDNTADTNLTPQEKFSSSVMVDFLNDSDDEDLSEYLENQIYKMGADYKGASIVEVSPAVWFITMEKDTLSKNYVLQKFVDFKTNEYYFRLKETSLTITDIITRRKSNTPAGE
ncbi:MAG TPA: hypothetical protein VGK25_03170 [Ignavibacteria bacterium]|jgi:hypothetical protein